MSDPRIPMTDDELKEFGRMTLHGCPPFTTVMKMYGGAMRLMDERNKRGRDTIDAVINTLRVELELGSTLERSIESVEALRVLVEGLDGHQKNRKGAA